MEKISRTVKNGTINGFVAPGFDGVVDAFAQNFDARDEVGASVCLSVEGETVVAFGVARATPRELRGKKIRSLLCFPARKARRLFALICLQTKVSWI